MGFGTVFATISFVFIFAAISVMVMASQDSITAAATQVKEEQIKLLQAQQQEIEIVSTSYGQGSSHEWHTTYNNEFEEGTTTNTIILADSVELTSASTQGTYTSVAYDTGFSSNYTTISWTAVIPANNNITFQVRSANTLPALLAAPFTGPDGSSSTQYSVPGTSLHSSIDNNRFIQFQANFTSNGVSTGTLEDVTVNIQRNTGSAKIVMTNSGKGKLSFEETDVYVDGVRILRNQANRILEFEDLVDTRLWNPGEEFNITVFTTIEDSATITVVNEFAKDQTAVSS